MWLQGRVEGSRTGDCPGEGSFHALVGTDSGEFKRISEGLEAVGFVEGLGALAGVAPDRLGGGVEEGESGKCGGEEVGAEAAALMVRGDGHAAELDGRLV